MKDVKNADKLELLLKKPPRLSLSAGKAGGFKKDNGGYIFVEGKFIGHEEVLFYD